jgi:co-chaperonin GroES (HSP10)
MTADTTTIVPLADWLLVRPDPAEYMTDSGLLVSADEREYRPCTGRVVAWGPEVPSDHRSRRVYFAEFSATPVPQSLSREGLLLLRVGDLIAHLITT